MHTCADLKSPDKTHAQMKVIRIIILLMTGLILIQNEAAGCSVLYYIDSGNGKIYFVNNEDYWYDVKAFIKIMPKSETTLARLWYGCDRFAQGGVNEKGLVFTRLLLLNSQ